MIGNDVPENERDVDHARKALKHIRDFVEEKKMEAFNDLDDVFPVERFMSLSDCFLIVERTLYRYYEHLRKQRERALEANNDRQ